MTSPFGWPLCAVLVLAAPVAAQTPLSFETPMSPNEDNLIGEMVGVPDADGDGADDLLVLANRHVDGGIGVVLSATSGNVIHSFGVPAGADADRCNGRRAALGPDLDGDGEEDYLVYVSCSDGPISLSGYSSATGAKVRDFPGPAPYGIVAFDDLNGDGVGEVLVASIADRSEVDYATDFGNVDVLDGATGGVLATIDVPSPTPDDGPGRNAVRSLLRVPDLDGDGRADLIVGWNSFIRDGAVFAFAVVPAQADGVESRLLWSRENPAPDQPGREGYYGDPLALVSDLDGDGLQDFATALVYFPDADDEPEPRYTGVRLQIAIASSASGDLVRQFPEPTVEGFRDGDQAGIGQFIRAVPDVDGDGVIDLFYAAPDDVYRAIEDVGRAFVVSGATGRRLLALDNPDPEQRAYFGDDIAVLGPSTAGGRPRLAVGASPATVYVYEGAEVEARAAGAEDIASRPVPLPDPGSGTALRGRFGSRLAAVPDVDGDGVTDVAASERVEGRDARTVLVSGATGAVLRAIAHPELDRGQMMTPSDIAGVPDADGDGAGDLVVGAQNGIVLDGRVIARLFSGASGAEIETYVRPQGSLVGGLVVAGLTAGGRSSVALTDAEGRDDDVVRVLEANGARVTSEFGSPTSAPLPPGERDYFFGAALAGLPGGRVLVGAPEETTDTVPDAGRAYLFDGAGGALLHTLASPSPTRDGWFGYAVAGVPDADGDGGGDLLVGACFEPASAGTPRAGRAYLFSGASGALIHALESPRPQEGGGFGCAVAGEDVDGDGVGDAVVGAYREDAAGHRQAGLVYAFSGTDGALLRTWRSGDPDPVGAFGIAVVALGDVDGDGLGDVAVSAPAEDDMAGVVYITRSASVAAGAGPEAGGLEVRAWPNPAADAVTVSLALAGASDARVSVVDVLGREIVTSAHAFGAGRQSVRLDVSALPAGAYVVRVEAGGEVASTHVTVVR